MLGEGSNRNTKKKPGGERKEGESALKLLRALCQKRASP